MVRYNFGWYGMKYQICTKQRKTGNLPNYITPNGSSPGNDLSPERHGVWGT